MCEGKSPAALVGLGVELAEDAEGGGQGGLPNVCSKMSTGDPFNSTDGVVGSVFMGSSIGINRD